MCIALKAQGYGIRPIRRMTKLPFDVIRQILRDARQAGELKDVLADMDHEIVPGAIENIRDAVLKDKDREISMKVLAGRGVLVAHQKSASASVASTTFEIVYKNAPADGRITPTGIVHSSPIVD